LDLIDWFNVYVPVCETRNDSLILGNRLLEFQFITPCNKDVRDFTDSDDLYEFSKPMETSQDGKTILNNRRNIMQSDAAVSSPLYLAQDLLETIVTLYTLSSTLVDKTISESMLAPIKDNAKFKVSLSSLFLSLILSLFLSLSFFLLNFLPLSLSLSYCLFRSPPLLRCFPWRRTICKE
jgi:hypothetical protein